MEKGFRNFDASKFKVLDVSESSTSTEVLDPDPEPETKSEDKPDDDQPEEKPKDDDVKPEGEKEQDQPEGEKPTDGSAKPEAEAAPEEYTEEDFLSDADLLIYERTSGAVKSINDVQAILKRNQELEAALKVKEPEFPNPQAKVLYENVIKAMGNNLNVSDKTSVSSAANYLRLASLDLATLSPKEKQLEAYVLSRPDISRLQAEKIFDKRYEQKFTDLEGDEIQADEHGIATREAEQKILSFQKEFTAVKKSEQPETPQVEDPKVIAQAIDDVLSDFGGLQMKFEDNDEPINLPLDEAEVAEFRETLVNPGRIIEKIVDKCVVNGKFDWGQFTREMFRLQYSDRAVEEAHRAGLTAGKIKIVKENKNTADPTKIKSGTGNAAPAEKKTYGQVMADAIAASNKR